VDRKDRVIERLRDKVSRQAEEIRVLKEEIDAMRFQFENDIEEYTVNDKNTKELMDRMESIRLNYLQATDDARKARKKYRDAYADLRILRSKYNKEVRQAVHGLKMICADARNEYDDSAVKQKLEKYKEQIEEGGE